MFDSFDRTVLGIATALISAIALLVALGEHARVGIEAIPGDGTRPAATTTIRLVFSQDMDRESVEAAFLIEPHTEGRLDWQGRTLIFWPAKPFEAGQPVTVTLDSTAVSVAGRQVPDGFQFQFVPREPGVIYLYPADAATRGLWLDPPGEGEPEPIYEGEQGVFSFDTSPDGAWIAMTLYNSQLTTDIWLVGVDGTGAHRLIDCSPGLCGTSAWSPDGRLLAYERQSPNLTGGLGPSRIWLYDLGTGETAPVYEDTQVLGYSPIWSRDGARLAFYDATVGAIRVVGVLDGSEYQVPNQMGEVGSFSPDGMQLVYPEIRSLDQQFFPELWLADLSVSGGLKPLLQEPQEDIAPVWSPDGEWIAFGRKRIDRQGGFTSQVWLYEVATGSLRQITDDPEYNSARFRWSPDGNRLLMQRYDVTESFTQPEVWVYDLAVDTFTRLVINGDSATWIP